MPYSNNCSFKQVYSPDKTNSLFLVEVRMDKKQEFNSAFLHLNYVSLPIEPFSL